MKRVCIFGSCVSRDIFEYNVGGELSVVKYFARSSFASLSAAPYVESDVLKNISSPFQRRVVQADMDKSFCESLKNFDCDVMLFDFIDNRFNLYQQGDKLTTISNEYKKAKGRLISTNVIPSGSLKYFELWKKGFEKIIPDLQKIEDKIILNKAFWTDSICGGGDRI